MKTDEELVNEIMEAGYGSKPSLLGTAAHYGAKMAAKGIYKGVKAAKSAYDNHPNVQMANQAELRQNVYKKLNQDFAHWEKRISGSTGVEPTEANLLAFAKEVYDFDATSVLSTLRTAPKTAQAAPAAVPKAGAPKASPAPAAAPAGKPAGKPAKKAAPKSNPRVVQHDKDGNQLYRHNSKTIDFDDEVLANQSVTPGAKGAAGKPEAKKESIDLTKSFSQIVMEADAAALHAQAAETGRLNTEQTHAFFDGMARLVLGNPQVAQNFLQNNQIGAPAAANTQTGTPAAKGAGKAPGAAPAAPAAPAGPGGSALKAELNKIITQMGAKIDPSVIQSLTAKLKETPDLKSAVDLVDSPQEIAAARAIMIAVIIATEM